jgi:hypothetical protein
MTAMGQIFVYKLYTFFVGCNASVLPLQHFNFVLNQIVVTTMKRMLNKMLRYADAIVKRGVDKLIDAIAYSAEPQTKNAETPQPQKRVGNDTNCTPQTTGSTTDCSLTEQTIALMDELCDMRYNVRFGVLPYSNNCVTCTKVSRTFVPPTFAQAFFTISFSWAEY